MIKKTVKFIDFNGVEQTEDFWFNLNKAEAIKLTAQAGGDIENFANYLMETKDLTSMVNFIQEMILMSVGVRDADGRRFIKNAEIRENFENSIAFAELFEELLTDTEACAAFGAGLVTVSNKKEATPQLEVLKDTKPNQTIEEIAAEKSKTPKEILEELIAANPDLVKDVAQPNT